MVSESDKEAVYSSILADESAGYLDGWDGSSFETLHDFVDANEYLLEIWEKYGDTPEEKMAACEETIDYVDELLARSYRQI